MLRYTYSYSRRLRLRNLYLNLYASISSSAPETPPPPLAVALTNHAGRAVFASRRIAAGQLIHTAKPIISHPSASSIHKVCYLCLRRLPNPPQNTLSFCSQHCEAHAKNFYDLEKKANWSRFDEYCRLQGLKYPLLIKRLACQSISGFVTSAIFDLHQPENLSLDKMSIMKEEFVLLRSTFEDSGVAHEQMSFLTEEWYVSVLARIRINAFRVELPVGSYDDLHSAAAASVEAEASVGNAMYMLPSFYNHDCDPNVNIIWNENADAKMVALRDIEEEEEMRICYLDASMGYEARQKFLYEGYGFKCNCSRCLSKD